MEYAWLQNRFVDARVENPPGYEEDIAEVGTTQQRRNQKNEKFTAENEVLEMQLNAKGYSMYTSGPYEPPQQYQEQQGWGGGGGYPFPPQNAGMQQNPMLSSWKDSNEAAADPFEWENRPPEEGGPERPPFHRMPTDEERENMEEYAEREVNPEAYADKEPMEDFHVPFKKDYDDSKEDDDGEQDDDDDPDVTSNQWQEQEGAEDETNSMRGYGNSYPQNSQQGEPLRMQQQQAYNSYQGAGSEGYMRNPASAQSATPQGQGNDQNEREAMMNQRNDHVYRTGSHMPQPQGEGQPPQGQQYPQGQPPQGQPPTRPMAGERRLMSGDELRAQMMLQKIAVAALKAQKKRGKKRGPSVVFL